MRGHTAGNENIDRSAQAGLWYVMLKAFRIATLIAILAATAGCAGSAGRWGQFHGDLSSRGFQPVSSGYALSAAWVSRPYKITSSSPVIGKDFQGREILYVGTTDGLLVAINAADGSEKWQRRLGTFKTAARIVSSPAVSKTGDIYVITSRRAADGRLHSTLHKVDPFSNPRWAYRFPDSGFTSGAPKVFTSGSGTLIFVFVTVDGPGGLQGQLFVLRDDRRRARLLARKALGPCCHEITGTGSSLKSGADFLKDSWNFVGTFPVASGQNGSGLPDFFVDPTVAVGSDGGQALIAVVGNLCSIGVYRWSGTQLSVLWRKEHKPARYSSPVLLANGLMVFGRRDGKVLAYDALTGVKMWQFDAGQPVLATPAAAPDQFVFLVSKSRIQVLHANDGRLVLDGPLARRLQLLAQTHASPAVTANRVYVSSGEMLTLSYDLKTRSHDSNFHGNGLSSVAVGSNGAVYAVAQDGTIRKYSGTQ